jgi:hypothetical protein
MVIVAFPSLHTPAPKVAEHPSLEPMNIFVSGARPREAWVLFVQLAGRIKQREHNEGQFIFCTYLPHTTEASGSHSIV